MDLPATEALRAVVVAKAVCLHSSTLLLVHTTFDANESFQNLHMERLIQSRLARREDKLLRWSQRFSDVWTFSDGNVDCVQRNNFGYPISSRLMMNYDNCEVLSWHQ